MSDTLLGMVIEVSPVQEANALYPILVTLLGMMRLVRLEQPSKDSLSILVTLLGIVIPFKPLHLKKAPYPMVVTLLGIIVLLLPVIRVFVSVSTMALHSPRESYLVFPVSTEIDVKPVHPKKAHFPMLVTLLDYDRLMRHKYLKIRPFKKIFFRIGT